MQLIRSRISALRVVVLTLCCLWSGAHAASAEAPAAQPLVANVQLGDATVFSINEGDARSSADERARLASQRLAEAAARPDPGGVRWEQHGDDAVVVLGITPIITLYPHDAELAHEPSLSAFAQRVAASVQAAVERERERAAVAQGVFSLSLVVFLGLVCLYLGRRLADWCAQGRRYLAERGRDMPALRLRGLPVLGPMALRGTLLLLVGFGRWFGVLGLFYTWLVVSLSMFAGTRPYVERLTGVVLAPLSALASRVATALPVLVVVCIAGLLVAVLVRTITLFFSSIARGEAETTWLSATAAPAVSVMARAAVVVSAIVFVAPVLTGDQDGPLSRVALVLIAAIAIASTPLLTCVLTGLAIVLSHGLRVGDRVEYGARKGVVREVGLFALSLEDDEGGVSRVAHLMALWLPTRVFPRGPA